MTDRWTTRSSRYLLRRWWLTIREDHVTLPGGLELPEYHVLEAPDWACCVCVREDGRIVLVEQYRHGIARPSLELPAGAVDEGESPEQAARRELLEETGYRSDDWVALGRVAPDPSRHTNWAHLFVARSARQVADPHHDDGEAITTVVLDGPGLRNAVDEGRLVHGIHVAALWAAACRGHLPAF